jgi:hypothetical protein
LDLSSNKLDAPSANKFLRELCKDENLRIVLMHGNPGYSSDSVRMMRNLIRKPMAEHFRDLPESLIRVLQRWTQAQGKYSSQQYIIDKSGSSLLSTGFPIAEVNFDVLNANDQSAMTLDVDSDLDPDEINGDHPFISPSVKQLVGKLKATGAAVKDFDDRNNTRKAAGKQKQQQKVEQKQVGEDSDDALDLLSNDDDGEDGTDDECDPNNALAASVPDFDASIGFGGVSAVTEPSGFNAYDER